MQKNILIVLMVIAAVDSASALSLHYGQWVMPLYPAKHTSPALNVQISQNEKWYGALYSGDVRANTVRFMANGTEYWLGPWCNAGTYMVPGTFDCRDCGIGHYCAGGLHRAPCTGGAIGCPGINHAADVAADPSLVNKMLTQDEVNDNIPPTDITQWRLVSACSESICPGGDGDLTKLNLTQCACALGVIGPGTYLFIQDYHLSASSAQAFTANIAVFDRPVGYLSMHSGNIFYNAVDTLHAPYQAFTIRSSTGDWWVTYNRTNVGNAPSGGTNMYVYELQ